MVPSLPVSLTSSHATPPFPHYTPATSILTSILEHTQLMFSSGVLHMLLPLPGVLVCSSPTPFLCPVSFSSFRPLKFHLLREDSPCLEGRSLLLPLHPKSLFSLRPLFISYIALNMTCSYFVYLLIGFCSVTTITM